MLAAGRSLQAARDRSGKEVERKIHADSGRASRPVAYSTPVYVVGSATAERPSHAGSEVGAWGDSLATGARARRPDPCPRRGRCRHGRPYDGLPAVDRPAVGVLEGERAPRKAGRRPGEARCRASPATRASTADPRGVAWRRARAGTGDRPRRASRSPQALSPARTSAWPDRSCDRGGRSPTHARRCSPGPPSARTGAAPGPTAFPRARACDLTRGSTWPARTLPAGGDARPGRPDPRHHRARQDERLGLVLRRGPGHRRDDRYVRRRSGETVPAGRSSSASLGVGSRCCP